MLHPENNMIFLPISLNITGKEILIIGGGKVAYHKIQLIMPYTSNIKVVGKEICDEIKELGIKYFQKKYNKSDLKGAFMVYACTNIKELNKQVYNDAHNEKILVNVVDNPPMCDFVSPAIYKDGHMTVSVGSNAQDVYASIKWRNEIKKFLQENPVQ